MSFRGGPAGSCPFCNGRNTRRLYAREFAGRLWHLARCPDCGLHFTDPQPAPADMAGFYKGDYHSNLRTPGGSERAFGEKYQRYTDWVCQFLKGGRSLDVGCATGLFPHMLSRRGFQAEGVEFSRDSAAWGREHYGVPIAVGSLEQVSSQTGGFDLVTMTDVLEHTANPVDALHTVNGILRDGGFMLVTFPDIASFKSRSYYWIARAVNRGWLWTSCHIPGHTWEFTPKTATMCFEKAGFEVAGFRRTELLADEWRGLWTPFAWWDRLLMWGPIADRFGTQMEFMLRKTGRPRT